MLKLIAAGLRRFFGLTVRTTSEPGDTKPVRGFWRRVFDWGTGMWQQDVAYDGDAACQITLNSVVFACLRLLSTDVGKLVPTAQKLRGDIWIATGGLLLRPNPTQSWMEFLVYWILCKLIYGNAYALKFRGAGNKIAELWLLDPRKVRPVIASSSGAVYYQLEVSSLEQITQHVVVTAGEVLHDKYLPLWHPLVGVPPLDAARLAATAGIYGLRSLQKLATNGGVPSGILNIPAGYSDEQIEALSERWEALRALGRTAILESGISFASTGVKAVDAQTAELIGYTGKDICTAFGVPPWKVGLEAMPAGIAYGSLQTAYYEGSLQYLIESVERLMSSGLELPEGVRVVLDITGLNRMDEKSRWEMYKVAGATGGMSPNEMRQRENMPAVEGGATPYLQQQNYSLAALAKRDAKEDPFTNASGGVKPGSGSPPDSPEPPDNPDDAPPSSDDQAMDLLRRWRGVWKADRTYAAGDLVTHHGLWMASIANRGGTPGKPDGFEAWRLVIAEH